MAKYFFSAAETDPELCYTIQYWREQVREQGKSILLVSAKAEKIQVFFIANISLKSVKAVRTLAARFVIPISRVMARADDARFQ